MRERERERDNGKEGRNYRVAESVRECGAELFKGEREYICTGRDERNGKEEGGKMAGDKAIL